MPSGSNCSFSRRVRAARDFSCGSKTGTSLRTAPLARTTPTDLDGTGGKPAPAFLGATVGTSDWTAPWSYGINPNNRAQALWFE